MDSSTAIRTQLDETLKLDLVGPSHELVFAHELLPQSPWRWYLAGFLVPSHATQELKSSGDEEMAEEAPEKVADADDTESSEPAPGISYLPSAMGLSVLLGPNAKQIEAVIRWGELSLGGGRGSVRVG